MAIWVTVYCRKDLPPFQDDQLRRILELADLHTLGEIFDLDEEEIDSAVDCLMFQPSTTSRDAVVLDVHFGSERPLSVWSYESGSASEQVEEALEEIPEALRTPGAERVRAHLAQTRSVVAVELNSDQLDSVAEVLAMVIAYAAAERGDGLVDFYGNEWYAPEDRATPVLVAGGK